MEQNLIVIESYNTVKELIELLQTIPEHWVFVTLECDGEPGQSLVACDPNIKRSIDRYTFDLFEELITFNKDAILHFKLTEDKEKEYEVYIFGEITEQGFQKLEDESDLSLDLGFFYNKYVNKGKIWISLNMFKDYFDLYDYSYIMEIVK